MGDILGEANCIRGLGDIELRCTDHEVARARYEEALPVYLRIPDPYFDRLDAPPTGQTRR